MGAGGDEVAQRRCALGVPAILHARAAADPDVADGVAALVREHETRERLLGAQPLEDRIGDRDHVGLLTDREAGVPQAEEGWVYIDELTQMLAFTKPRINLEIFRLRKLLTANRVAGAGRIVERRAGSGQLRIGVADVRVIDGRSATTR